MSHCESVDSSILDTTVESFDRHYAVNVRATWLLIAAFARQLDRQLDRLDQQRDRPSGTVLALTSDHTVHNLPYGVTKGALDRLVLASAHELGERGLRANVINPGPVDTGWMTDEIRAAGLAQQPTGRLGTPGGRGQSGPVPAVRAGQLDQRSTAVQQRRLPQRITTRRSHRHQRCPIAVRDQMPDQVHVQLHNRGARSRCTLK